VWPIAKLVVVHQCPKQTDSEGEPRKSALDAPSIHAALVKLGIHIETSVGKYLVRRRKPPLQDWRTFLENHLKTMVSIDFLTALTIRFQG